MAISGGCYCKELRYLSTGDIQASIQCHCSIRADGQFCHRVPHRHRGYGPLTGEPVNPLPIAQPDPARKASPPQIPEFWRPGLLD